MKQFVTFTIDEQLFGIEILYVRELNQISEITDIELAPDYIAGLLNLRGQVVTIFDIGKRLGYESRLDDAKTCNIILKTDAELTLIRGQEVRSDLHSSESPAGLLVDAFGDIVEVEDDCVESAPANIMDQESMFIANVVKIEDMLFSVLDVSKLLLSDEELGMEAAMTPI